MQNQSVCPWYMGWLLAHPLRKRFHNPEEILQPFVKSGMKVVDYGCAMGFFTLPMARMVGETGKVYGLDIQPKMISGLSRRAGKAGLRHIIEPLAIQDNEVISQLAEEIDFVLIFAMVHEVPSQAQLFKAITTMLKPGGTVLFAEPKGHVSQSDFEESIEVAITCGLKVKYDVPVRGSHGVLLFK